MYLSTKGTIIGTLALGLLACASIKTHAQDIPEYLSVALTATVQGDDKTSGSNGQITKHVTNPTRWTTKSLLTMIQSNLGTTFTKGKLALLGGSAIVVDSSANSPTDVSSILNIDAGDSVTTGQENSENGAQNTTTTTYVTLSFDDGAGNSFTISGLIKQVYSTSASTDKSGNSVAQKETVSLTGTLSGTGTVNGATAVFSGSVSGSGSGKVGG